MFLCDTLSQNELQLDKILFIKNGLMSHDTLSKSELKQLRIFNRRLEVIPRANDEFRDYKWKEIHVNHEYDLSNIHGSGL